MKRIFILAIAAVATTTMMISCGQGSAKLTTDTDSLTYAIGTLVGNQAFHFDSTMDVNVVITGVKDIFAKKGKMSPEEAQAFLQEYMTVRMPLKNAAAGKEFIEEAIEDGADTLANGLAYKIKEKGNDIRAAIGDSVYVNYVLTLPEGQIVDQSQEGIPTGFLLQPLGMIQAWIEGVPLVGEGGEITLYVPSSLGYGPNGSRSIRPNQALKFEIELVKVVKIAATPAAE